jgi:hypothetical protein
MEAVAAAHAFLQALDKGPPPQTSLSHFEV